MCLNAFAIQMLVFNLDKITLPHFSSKTKAAIEAGTLSWNYQGCEKCVAYYEPILLQLTGGQYTAIAKALLKKYPCLRNNGTING